MARSSKPPEDTDHPGAAETAARGSRRSGPSATSATKRSRAQTRPRKPSAKKSKGGSRRELGGLTARRSDAMWAVFALAAGVTLFLAGWVVATTTAPGHTANPGGTVARATAHLSGAASSEESITPGPTFHCGVAEPTATLLFNHDYPRLKDKLPDIIAQVCLQKVSYVLSAYTSSPPAAGEKPLYAPWLKRFNTTPDKVGLALAVDVTEQIELDIRAIQVPGAIASELQTSFGEVATAAGWPVQPQPNYIPGKSPLLVIDPDTAVCRARCGDYVYASGDVLYVIHASDPNLISETMIWLP